MKPLYITIGRQYGSGGREIGNLLSDKLGIPFYDKELLTAAAEESGWNRELFEQNDEKSSNSFLYSLVMGAYHTTESLPVNHKLFLAQFEAIRKIAKQGSCIVIGRCADYALEEFPGLCSVFLHAGLPFRVKRAVEVYGLDETNAQEVVLKTDKQRAQYYNFYTSRKWASLESYDLTLNTETIGVAAAAELIGNYCNEFRK